MRVLIIGAAGYIGSRVYEYLLKVQGFEVYGVDIGWFGIAPQGVMRRDYNTLHIKFIQAFDAVILLAGHSSVGMCVDNPYSVHHNNVLNFLELLGYIKSRQKLIYASSASVYGSNNIAAIEGRENFYPRSHYDLSKFNRDCFARLSDVDYYGLRFATVCGFSPNFRSDTIINSMTMNALKEKVVKLANSDKFRSILDIKDLCAAIHLILTMPGSVRGIYNLASYSASIGELATDVARLTDSRIEPVRLSTNYSFQLNTARFEQQFLFAPQGTTKSIVLDLIKHKQDIEQQIETKDTTRSKRLLYAG